MKNATVNGVELEYELIGSGEPVLMISPVLADGFVPLVAEPSLAERYQLIRYHKRGWVGSTHTAGPVSVADHAAEPPPCSITWGSPGPMSSATPAARPSPPSWPSTNPNESRRSCCSSCPCSRCPAVRRSSQAAAPVFETYAGGDHEGALAMFLSAVSGLESATCRELLEERIPGAVAQAIKDADTFFGVELPGAHPSGPSAPSTRRPSASRCCPCLAATPRRCGEEVAEFLRNSVSRRRGAHDRRGRAPAAHPAS